MPRSKEKTAYKVVVYEMERGWGRKIYDERYFTSPEEAKAEVKRINDKNTAPTAPDYYIYAVYEEN